MRSFLVLLLVLALPINGMAQLLMPVGSSAHHVMPDRVGIEAMAASHASMAGVSGADPSAVKRMSMERRPSARRAKNAKLQVSFSLSQ